MLSPLVIICSAPFFIHHTLSLYSSARQKGRKVVIYITDTRSVYDFIVTLHLNVAKLCFIETTPAARLGAPLTALSTRRKLTFLTNQMLAELADGELYYFGEIGDETVDALVGGAARNGRPVTKAVEPSPGVRLHQPRTLRQSLRLKLLSWITRCPLIYGSMGDSETYRDLALIDEKKLGINQQPLKPDPKILKEYLFKCASPGAPSKTILLLESADGEYYLNYESRMRELLGELKDNGYYILLKPHPRQGHSQFLGELADTIVPDFVPAQFLDRSAFAFVVSNMSSAMRDFASEGIPTFALEFLHQPINQSDNTYFTSILNEASVLLDPRHRIRFPKTMNDLLAGLSQS